MFKGGNDFWNSDKPSYMEAEQGSIDINKVFWDDRFVDEIRQSLHACEVFMLIPTLPLPTEELVINSTTCRLRWCSTVLPTT